jgi:hypothetical protein
MYAPLWSAEGGFLPWANAGLDTVMSRIIRRRILEVDKVSAAFVDFLLPTVFAPGDRRI